MELCNPFNNSNHNPSPPENPSNQPEAEEPPRQEPTLENTGYHPINTFQDHQERQNPVYVPRVNPLNKLDQGCFQCYKIYLYLILGFSVISIANMIVISFRFEVDIRDFISAFLVNVVPAIFTAIQLKAISQRNLKKAKIALAGFVAYLIIFPVCVVGVSLYDIGYISTELAIQSGLSLLGFAVSVLFGSIQVYQFLKRNQSENDSYQNLDNFTQNPLMA